MKLISELWDIFVITTFDYWTRDFAKSARLKLKKRLHLKTLIIIRNEKQQVAPVWWLYLKWYRQLFVQFLNHCGITPSYFFSRSQSEAWHG